MLNISGFLKLYASPEMDTWKATPRDSVVLKTSNGAPFQSGCLDDYTTTEIRTPRCGLAVFCYFFFVISLLEIKYP